MDRAFADLTGTATLTPHRHVDIHARPIESPRAMPDKTRIVSPAFPYGNVRLEDGTKTRPPDGWALLEPGDATLTRRVKEAGPSWTVQVEKGRKKFSMGVWALEATIERIRTELESERATPEYEARLARQRERSARAHEAYVAEFRQTVLDFLAFAPAHRALAEALAEAVTAHATPVGSGTVARTKRISVEQRAEAAVIAWMRHQTTAYDHMNIPRIKGMRRETRAALAKESRRLLASYRPEGTPPIVCPLRTALAK